MSAVEHVAVIGAGPAGLAAARRLRAKGVEVTVYERASGPGGRSATAPLTIAGKTWRFDAGAEFIASFYTAAHRLVRELGLTDTLVRLPIDSTVVREGVVHRLPADPLAVLRTGLLRPRSKARAIWLGTRLATRRKPRWNDLAGAAELDDRTAAAEFNARVGADYTDNLLRATLDSLTLSPAEDTSRVVALAQLRHAAGARLACPAGGIGVFTEALAHGLSIRYDTRITDLDELDADAVILAVPPASALRLLPPDHPDHALAARARFNAAVKVHAALDAPVPGLRPTCPVGAAEPPLAGVNPLSAKGTGQAPSGCEGLEICAAPWLGERLLHASDEEITGRLWREAERLLGRRLPEPLGSSVVRLAEGVPRFDVGWLRRLRDRPRGGRVVTAGDWLASPSLEGAIRSGQAAADALT